MIILYSSFFGVKSCVRHFMGLNSPSRKDGQKLANSSNESSSRNPSQLKTNINLAKKIYSVAL